MRALSFYKSVCGRISDVIAMVYWIVSVIANHEVLKQSLCRGLPRRFTPRNDKIYETSNCRISNQNQKFIQVLG